MTQEHDNKGRKTPKNPVIYKTTNLINNKIYIGKDLYNMSSYYGSGVYIKRAIKKYGKENFKKEILEYCDESILNDREIFYIDYYNSIDINIGYNLSTGGTGGDLGPIVNKIHSETKKRLFASGILKPNKNRIYSIETRKRMSDSAKLRPKRKCTDETKRKLSIANKGKKHKSWGHHTPESKLKMSTAAKKRHVRSGYTLTEEHKKKISIGNHGKIRSDISKKNHSIIMKGRLIGELNPASKKVLICSENKTFETVTGAMKYLKIGTVKFYNMINDGSIIYLNK